MSRLMLKVVTIAATLAVMAPAPAYAKNEKTFATLSDIGAYGLTAVALGLPDPQLGQAIHLVARAMPGADKAGLIPALTRALPNFMVPRHVHWREVMPVSPNGKLDRVALAAELAEEMQP